MSTNDYLFVSNISMVYDDCACADTLNYLCLHRYSMAWYNNINVIDNNDQFDTFTFMDSELLQYYLHR